MVDYFDILRESTAINVPLKGFTLAYVEHDRGVFWTWMGSRNGTSIATQFAMYGSLSVEMA